MLGQAIVRTPSFRPVAAASRRGVARWQRRAIEVAVSLLAFAVWGKLAYSGFFRLLARADDLPLQGHWLIDVLSLVIGVSGSIAGVSALWAVVMRALGRTPASLIGAPDDDPADTAYRRAHERAAAGEAAGTGEPGGPVRR